MARSILKPIKALWDRAGKALRGEHNTLVDEMDELKTNYAALLAKLDADVGVTDENYVETLANSATEAKKIEVR